MSVLEPSITSNAHRTPERTVFGHVSERIDVIMHVDGLGFTFSRFFVIERVSIIMTCIEGSLLLFCQLKYNDTYFSLCAAGCLHVFHLIQVTQYFYDARVGRGGGDRGSCEGLCEGL